MILIIILSTIDISCFRMNNIVNRKLYGIIIKFLFTAGLDVLKVCNLKFYIIKPSNTIIKVSGF